jgi:flagellar motility protein MotE (MotC chaperone)
MKSNCRKSNSFLSVLRLPEIERAAAALGLVVLFGGAAVSGVLAAGDAKPPSPKSVPIAAKVAPQLDLKKTGTLAEQYCKSIREPASEARFAFQAAELKALGKDIDERIAKLELRAAELKEWFARREQFSKQASEQVVNIYSAMRPEAASEQLSKMDETTAAAILSRLEPRAASTILNDIQAEKAARLTMILTGASRKNDRGGKS